MRGKRSLVKENCCVKNKGRRRENRSRSRVIRGEGGRQFCELETVEPYSGRKKKKWEGGLVHEHKDPHTNFLSANPEIFSLWKVM